MEFLIQKLKIEAGLDSVKVVKAPKNYFDLNLEERVDILGAASTDHLCKTIIMQNTRYGIGVKSFPDSADDATYPQNVIVLTQFTARLNANRLVNIMKQHQNDKTQASKVTSKGFKFRHAEEEIATGLTGYPHNSITPFFTNEGANHLPIIVSKSIADLDPGYLWLSGGTHQVKLGISFEDFKRYFGDRVLVADTQ